MNSKVKAVCNFIVDICCIIGELILISVLFFGTYDADDFFYMLLITVLCPFIAWVSLHAVIEVTDRFITNLRTGKTDSFFYDL